MTLPPPLLAALITSAILALLSLGGVFRRTALEFPTRGRRTAAWLLLAVILYASVAMPLVLSGEEPSLDVEDLSLLALFTGHLGLTAFLLAWWALRRPIDLPRFLHIDRVSPDEMAAGLGLGLKVWGYTFGVALLAGVLLQWLAGTGGAYAGTAVEVPEIPDVMIWMVELPVTSKLLIVLVAMTVEEAFFRAFLQSRIGLLPSSVLFAFAHASYGLPTLMVGVFVVSIIIGLDFARRGNLMRSILAHGVFDAIQLLVVVPYAVGQLQQMGG